MAFISRVCRVYRRDSGTLNVREMLIVRFLLLTLLLVFIYFFLSIFLFIFNSFKKIGSVLASCKKVRSTIRPTKYSSLLEIGNVERSGTVSPPVLIANRINENVNNDNNRSALSGL